MRTIYELIRDTDYGLLRKQKESLLKVIDNYKYPQFKDDNKLSSDLEGILHLIDSIQDSAVEYFSEEEVFGLYK